MNLLATPGAGPITSCGLSSLRWFTRFVLDPVRCLCLAYRRFGPLSCLGSVLPWKRDAQKSVLALGPEYNRLVLGDVHTFHTTPQTRGGPINSALRRVRGGLTAMNGETHRRQRQLVLPHFVKTAFDGYYPTVLSETDRIIGSWPAGTPIDAARRMRQLMLRLSARVLFSREEPQQADRLGEMIGDLFQRNWKLGVFLFPFDLPGTPMRRLLRHADALERELLSMIARRRSRPTLEAGDMLDLLIRCRDSSNEMTDADLLGQATILFAASYETQANAMTWTLFLLAQHPHVLHQLCDELAGLSALPSQEEIESLPYLEMVLKESMRILPSVPFTIRMAAADTELGSVSLRAGDRVICSHYVTHHLPELYEEPQRFRPERWEHLEPSQYEYLPFSAGPRWCIGKHLAMLMMRVALARIVQKWRFSVVSNSRIDRHVSVTMGTKNGLPMVFALQDRRFEPAPVRGNIHEMVDLSPSATVLAHRVMVADNPRNSPRTRKSTGESQVDSKPATAWMQG